MEFVVKMGSNLYSYQHTPFSNRIDIIFKYVRTKLEIEQKPELIKKYF